MTNPPPGCSLSFGCKMLSPQGSMERSTNSQQMSVALVLLSIVNSIICSGIFHSNGVITNTCVFVLVIVPEQSTTWISYSPSGKVIVIDDPPALRILPFKRSGPKLLSPDGWINKEQ